MGTEKSAVETDAIFRVIDANINRVSEGLRVLEDEARFWRQDGERAKAFRTLRHQVRKTFEDPRLILSRAPRKDPGLRNSQEGRLDERKETESLLIANFKRAQEGLRSIEEHLKLLGERTAAKKYEELRFEVYELERQQKSGEWGKQRKLTILKEGGLYGITGEEFSKGRKTLDCVKEMLEAGIKVLQYREKTKDGGTRLAECQTIRKWTAEKQCLFIVNDEVALAMAVGADGVHVGQEDLPLEVVRKIVGPEMLVGVSTHKPEQAQAAERGGADYIGVGPMFQTKTKPGVEPSEGRDYLDWVREHITLPRVAIGGIRAENLPQLMNGPKDKTEGKAQRENETKVIGKEEKIGGKEKNQWYAVISEIMGAVSIKEKVAELEGLIYQAEGEKKNE